MPKGDPIVDFTWLKELQARKGLQLTTCETPAGKVPVDGQPAAFVAELIRLAEIGQKLEIATARNLARAEDEGVVEMAVGLRGMARERMETMDEAEADVLIRSAVALETRRPIAAPE